MKALRSRSPCGERGLKLKHTVQIQKVVASLPVRGAWVEIVVHAQKSNEIVSLPVRGAWVEIASTTSNCRSSESLPVRGAWVEMAPVGVRWLRALRSLPVRGAWVEMPCVPCIVAGLIVAPRAGSVG